MDERITGPVLRLGPHALQRRRRFEYDEERERRVQRREGGHSRSRSGNERLDPCRGERRGPAARSGGRTQQRDHTSRDGPGHGEGRERRGGGPVRDERRLPDGAGSAPPVTSVEGSLLVRPTFGGVLHAERPQKWMGVAGQLGGQRQAVVSARQIRPLVREECLLLRREQRSEHGGRDHDPSRRAG